MLADDHKKRVIIVDTSNEIGGDGDVPHFGIGHARRMQVPNVHLQHNVSLILFLLWYNLIEDPTFRMHLNGEAFFKPFGLVELL